MIAGLCIHCSQPKNEASLFCGNCGKKASHGLEVKENKAIQLVIAFYLSFLVFAVVSFFVYDDEVSLENEIIMESIFILLTIAFTFFGFKKVYALYSIKQLNLLNVSFSILFPVVSAVVVFYSINYINEAFFGESTNVFFEYEGVPNAFFWILIFYTVIPPIFEELAFRGFLFNQLSIIANWKVTVLATAFLFALVHFSFVSFLWIFPFGIVLGYLRHRYKTLWLGMIIHFIHNLLVVLLDYVMYTQVLE